MSSATKPAVTISIDDLPPEMICELFKHLNAKTLVICSMVNKRWHSICSNFKVKKLVAVQNVDYFLQAWCKWNCHSNWKIKVEELCQLKMFGRLADKPLLSNLQHLALCCYHSEFDTNNLNQFTELLHLEIDIENLAVKKLTLKLPKLKLLKFHRFHYCALSIDCPQLSTLGYYHSGRTSQLLDLKHPETIKCLETNLSGALASFKNVECLISWDFSLISKDTLQSLPKLKDYRYNGSINWLIRTHAPASEFGQVKETLRQFVANAKQLRGSDFKFTFSGLPLSKVSVDQIDFGLVGALYERLCDEYVYLHNCHLIEPGALNFHHSIDYNRLVSYAVGEIPSCFFKMFPGHMAVEVSGAVQDEDHLLWFLKSLNPFEQLDLHLNGSELSQQLFDRLPATAESLVKLTLIYEGDIQINFDFIEKFSHLSSLYISCPNSSRESVVAISRSFDTKPKLFDL